ncbi:DUF1972 domain-containing protein [Aquimarina litoralis]|uniref:DUF1972 domain-containing protein n=1 Tax=Aquimarina litoralis TaxID=584605 RepID=UPI001C592161|nr:DUF1972 domain-containing protein [Aquimarina litoralis]MBW1293904.1 DUF1972 domain-containing protein [Aquimarina litoralis]
MTQKSKVKIAVIGTVGVPGIYGGFETLADYLIQNLSNEFDFTVYCSKKKYKDRPKTYHGARLIYLPIEANGKSSILYDIVSIFHALFYADTLLILGVSGAFVLPFVKLFTRKKIITNIDGLEWKRDKWGKYAKKYLKKQEEIAVNYSHEIISDNKGIQDHVSESYNSSSNLIAYGGDHVFYEKLNSDTKTKYNLPDKYAFKVCRIEPENNIHIILEAFRNTNLNLVLVGNWNNNLYGTELKNEYTDDNLYLLDPIYDQKKLNELRSNCWFYIHGHSAGGTNPSLVEAMNLGLAIIAFDVHYNRFTTNNKAVYFKTAQDLKEKLNYIIEHDEIVKIGSKMKSIAKEEYTWPVISKKYKNLFLL